ncbi:AAA family ATPase [Salinarimonas chemoclinalis]|uniref:AAA family ATPase n=1 Tax=Salinarimonas chemoclinalis TaxID=3241599 RepID=UPI0035593341
MGRSILITGMSGTGKSAVVAALVARGRSAIDLDADGWSEWVPCEGDPTGARAGYDWLWNEAKLAGLLAAERDAPLFVAGCASNMGAFVRLFDRVVLLTAPLPLLLDRVRARSGGLYGKTAHERQRIAENARAFEPRLRAIASDVIEVDLPLDEVVARIETIAA